MVTVVNIILPFFVVLHVVTAFFLFLYALNVLFMALSARKYIDELAGEEIPVVTDYPMVTIQLPLFNERYVAERIIRATAAIDYPQDKLYIQVVDDSTDECLAISQGVAESLRGDGYLVDVVHRTIRTGQKGGGLREAMEHSKGEFIAIFDADFIPDPGFLKNTIPFLVDDAKVGMVQTRWGHLNADYSPLTKAQAVAIDTHFIIEQTVRHRKGLYFNFNGTGGVWRKEAIYDAGNWQDDTITEDLDLSYRAQMKGWRFHYCPQFVNPAELPVQLTAYKSQQHRWAKGSIQTAIKLAKTVFTQDSPVVKKMQAILHLTYYMVHPLLLLNATVFLPLMIALKFWEAPAWLAPIWGDGEITTAGFLFTIGLMSIAPISTVIAQQLISPDNWKKRMLWLPHLIFIGTGVAVNNSRAVFEALLGKKSEFIRTPKLGIITNSEKWKDKKYSMPITGDALVELMLIIYLLGATAVAIYVKLWFIIPFLLYYMLSFGYVFGLGLVQNGHLTLPSWGKKSKSAVTE